MFPKCRMHWVERNSLFSAANLGNNSDTAAAIYGQLAGAYYGIGGIPEHWRETCFMSSLILLFADELHRLSFTIAEAPPLDVMESTYLRGIERYAGEGEKGLFEYGVNVSL